MGQAVESTLQSIQTLVQTTGLQHVAVIMDGNRRWAKQKHFPSLLGHKQGVDVLKALVRYCGEVHIGALTVYAFSTENWQRDTEEVGYLMKLFLEALAAELHHLHANNVRIRFIGDLNAFAPALQALIQTAHNKTEANTGLNFQIAANYGGRHELTQAMQTLGQKIQAGTLAPEAITEDLIRAHLYQPTLKDPDLLIRTGGEFRTSNFLLWQCAYTEFYVTPTLWPDFNIAAFNAAIEDFAARQRRFGQ